MLPHFPEDFFKRTGSNSTNPEEEIVTTCENCRWYYKYGVGGIYKTCTQRDIVDFIVAEGEVTFDPTPDFWCKYWEVKE